jgi:hypothetical protein
LYNYDLTDRANVFQGIIDLESMGEFGQNLLKLTEFPFSYSLIGLLALIFGHGMDLEELDFGKIGPLFIIMGFVATSLSICDPVGALQRLMLSIQGGFWVKSNARSLLNEKIWGSYLSYFPPPYLFAIAYSPEGIKKRISKINWDLIERVFSLTKEFSSSLESKIAGPRPEESTSVFLERLGRESAATRELWEHYEGEIDRMGERYIEDMGDLIEALKRQAIKTKWITTEIDRITALIYFMIVITIFIVAIIVIGDFLPKFAQSFGNIDSSKIAILIFSTVALGAVAYMFKIRINGLEKKALIVFKYLTSLGAIKADKEKFRASLEDIERYLNEDHWALAEYWVNRIQVDYSEQFLEDVKKNG